MKAGEAISKILAGENDLASNHPIKEARLLETEHKSRIVTYSAKDAILYALGGDNDEDKFGK